MTTSERFGRRLQILTLIVLLLGGFSQTGLGQTFSAQIQNFWNQLRTGVLSFTTLHVASAGTLNFGATTGPNGYGIRDNGPGTLQFKNLNGSWNGFPYALCDTSVPNCSAVAYVDAGVQNQWNVMSVLLPASTLQTVGDTIDIQVNAQTATNANVKAMQLYLGGTTCTGSGGSCCAAGAQFFSVGPTTSNGGFVARATVHKTGTNAQLLSGSAQAAASVLATANTVGAVTDSGTIPLVFCATNTSASAATLQGTPEITVRRIPQ